MRRGGVTHVALEYFNLWPANQVVLILLEWHYTKVHNGIHRSEGDERKEKANRRKDLMQRGLDLIRRESRPKIGRRRQGKCAGLGVGRILEGRKSGNQRQEQGA